MSHLSIVTPDADRELSQRVHLFLSGSSQPVLRNLEVTARAGTIFLRGRVRSFYHRQLALEFTRRVAGVIQIVDELVVDERPPQANNASSSAVLPPVNLQVLSPMPTSPALI